MAQNGSIVNALALGSSNRAGRLIHNQEYRGGHFLIQRSTAVGTVTNKVTVEALVPGTTGTFYTVAATTDTSFSDAAITVLRIYPGLSTATNIVNDVLPEWFRVRTTSGTTGQGNLRVHANLIL